MKMKECMNIIYVSREMNEILEGNGLCVTDVITPNTDRTGLTKLSKYDVSYTIATNRILTDIINMGSIRMAGGQETVTGGIIEDLTSDGFDYHTDIIMSGGKLPYEFRLVSNQLTIVVDKKFMNLITFKRGEGRQYFITTLINHMFKYFDASVVMNTPMYLKYFNK